jgi:hypothetical protein
VLGVLIISHGTPARGRRLARRLAIDVNDRGDGLRHAEIRECPAREGAAREELIASPRYGPGDGRRLALVNGTVPLFFVCGTASGMARHCCWRTPLFTFRDAPLRWQKRTLISAECRELPLLLAFFVRVRTTILICVKRGPTICGQTTFYDFSNVESPMLKIAKAQIVTTLLAAGLLGCLCGTAPATVRIEGQVQAGGGPLASSTVTLWAASAAEPKQLAQAKTGSDGRFEIGTEATPGTDVILYLIAKRGEATISKASGDNPAIALLSVLGNTAPAQGRHQRDDDGGVGVDQRPILRRHGDPGARVKPAHCRWQRAQLYLQTGGWGSAIQDPLNSGQTPTMGNFATLVDLLSACATRVKADACNNLFAATTDPNGKVPTDTLAMAQSSARYPWYQPEKLFALLDQFYPVPKDANLRSNLRPVPFMPYLNLAPSAWVLPLKFDGIKDFAQTEKRSNAKLSKFQPIHRWWVG